MNYRKDKLEFEKQKDELELYLQNELDYIKENYGYTDTKNQMLMLKYFLINCHDTISRISSEFCGLSKSTYSTEVYISEIRDRQERHHQMMYYDDLNDFLKSKPTVAEMQEFIDNYFTNRN